MTRKRFPPWSNYLKELSASRRSLNRLEARGRLEVTGAVNHFDFLSIFGMRKGVKLLPSEYGMT